MRYYKYDLQKDYDSVKDKLSELATTTFETGINGMKVYAWGEKSKIQSMMTDICKQTFGKCDPENRLFNDNNSYEMDIRLVNPPVAGLHHCIIKMETPLTSAEYQSKGCYAEHIFLATFKYRESRDFFRNSEHRLCCEITVLECELWYEGLHQLYPLSCVEHHINPRSRTEAPEES